MTMPTTHDYAAGWWRDYLRDYSIDRPPPKERAEMERGAATFAVILWLCERPRYRGWRVE